VQSYINNPTPSSLFPSNVVYAAFVWFKRTPSLSIGLQPLRQFALSPLRPLLNLHDTSSQGVHFSKPIIELNLDGARNVLTCMVGSNSGESKDYIFMVAEYRVTTWSNALPKKDT
jgi:hypothetical protein